MAASTCSHETERMIGAPELALLPAGAVFINIGRGALVDEPALVEALRAGRLLGAGLDVFAHEPLPPDSPLWDMPNVIVSSHSASTSIARTRGSPTCSVTICVDISPASPCATS